LLLCGQHLKMMFEASFSFIIINWGHVLNISVGAIIMAW
jgi:hypothetical protein